MIDRAGECSGSGATTENDISKELLHSLFLHAPVHMVFLSGAEHRIEIASRLTMDLLGGHVVIGRKAEDFLARGTKLQYLNLLERLFRTGGSYVETDVPIFVKIESKQREARFLDLTYEPLRDRSGKIHGILIVGHDVTRRKLEHDALAVSNERLKFAVEGTRDGIWDWNLVSKRVLYSARYKEILGYDESEIAPLYEEWEKRIHREDAERVQLALANTLRNDVPFQEEYRMQCKAGHWKWVLCRGNVVTRNSEGHPLRVTGTMTDISEKKQSEELVWRHANFDSLTGLPNRRLFRDRLEQELLKAQRTGRKLGLLFIDLDHFKEINDLFGHTVGDKVLIEVARRIGTCVRESDTIARLSGDEFTVILPELSERSHIEDVAQKTIAQLLKPFMPEKERAQISASIGIAQYPRDASNTEELIQHADQAMYAAKRGGRSCFRFFRPSMQKAAQERVRLAQDLAQALPNNELQVLFQPIVDLASRDIVKAEALLRWRHPLNGQVYPGKFIALAEEFGYIHEIGDWTLETASTWAQRWRTKLGKPFEVSVNRSPVQFQSPSSQDWVNMLHDKDIRPGCISIEITEGLLLNASSKIKETLLRYRDAGIHVALDDFGTGYSSMSYLMDFHIDYLKIDQSFVRDITTNHGSRTIVESMILMAHKLGMKVIAEGIETIEQASILEEAGCDFGQGFYFSKPLPPELFETML